MIVERSGCYLISCETNRKESAGSVASFPYQRTYEEMLRKSKNTGTLQGEVVGDLEEKKKEKQFQYRPGQVLRIPGG